MANYLEEGQNKKSCVRYCSIAFPITRTGIIIDPDVKFRRCAVKGEACDNGNSTVLGCST